MSDANPQFLVVAQQNGRMRNRTRTRLTVVIRVGDLLGFYLAHRLICKAEDIEGGLPSTLRAKMYLFAIIDVVGGFVPFFGDIFDAFYKANTRNAWLLEDYLSTKGEAKAKGMQSVLPEGHDVDMEMLGEGEQPHPPQQAHKYGRR